MPGKSNGNLIPKHGRSTEERRANGEKGGVASGEARRKKKERREIFRDVLEGKYPVKGGGEMTGEEMLIHGIATNLSDPKSKHWLGTVKLIVESMGYDQSPELKEKLKAEIAHIKADTALTEEKTKAIRGERNGIEHIEDDDLTKALEAVARDMDNGNE